MTRWCMTAHFNFFSSPNRIKIWLLHKNTRVFLELLWWENAVDRDQVLQISFWKKRRRGRFRNSCHLVFLKKEIYKKHNFILNLNFIEQEKIFVFIHAIASYIILHLIFKESRKKIKPRSARQGGATARKCYIKSATCSPHILNCISLWRPPCIINGIPECLISNIYE